MNLPLSVSVRMWPNFKVVGNLDGALVYSEVQLATNIL